MGKMPHPYPSPFPKRGMGRVKLFYTIAHLIYDLDMLNYPSPSPCPSARQAFPYNKKEGVKLPHAILIT